MGHGFRSHLAVPAPNARPRLNYREIVLSEDAQNGLLQFPQGFLGCYNIHLKQIALGGNALLQLLHSLNEGINYLILLQEDAVIILLQYFDCLFHISGKLQNMLVMIRVVRDACTML